MTIISIKRDAANSWPSTFLFFSVSNVGMATTLICGGLNLVWLFSSITVVRV